MVIRYQIEFTSAAARQFRKLPAEARRRLAARIDALAADPRPPGAVAIKGADRTLRLRVGDYRILYRVDDDRLVILLVRVGHRREIYDR